METKRSRTNTVLLILTCAVVLLPIGLAACDSLEEEPYGFTSSNDFYQTPDEIRQALTAAYEVLADGGLYASDWLYVNDAASEIATTRFQRNEDGGELDFLDVNPNNGLVENIWRASYEGINRANTVIINAPGVEFADEKLQSRVVAEARFLRALHYFNLVRLFGGVPLSLEATTEVSSDLQKPRASVDEVYEAIISDLEFAEQNLLPRGETEQGKATIGATRTLLGKVYLTRERWSDARDMFEQVINAGTYDLLDNFEQLWNGRTSGSEEIIFATQFADAPGAGGPDNTIFAPLGSDLAPESATSTVFAEMPFYENFPAGPRKEATFLTEYVDPATGDTISFPEFSPRPYPHNEKYIDTRSPTRDFVDVPILRYAEVLLMYAKVLNEINQGPTTEAYRAVNQVRNRSELEDLPTGLSYSQFDDAVFQETRWELAFEGHGYVGLIRTGRLKQVVERAAMAHPYFPNNVSISETDYRLPIPERELDVNPNLDQNPGY